MIGLMERSTSKAVLGGTLTSGEGEHGTQALGKVHNELRHDLKKSDARQLATTLTRQLVYPILAVNRGRTSLHRCPRLVLDTQQPEDIKLLSDSLPKLVNMGMRIKADWAHSKLKIPMAEEKDPILQPIAPSFGNGDDAGGLAGLAAMGRRQSAPAQLARLKAAPGDPTNTAADAIDSLVDAMLDEWQANSDPVQTAIQQALDSSTSFEDFRVAVEQRLAAMDATALADLLSRGTLAARLWGNLTNGGRTTWPPSSWSRCHRERLSSSFARRATGWRSPGRTCPPRNTPPRSRWPRRCGWMCSKTSAAPPTARSPRAPRFRNSGVRSARSCRTKAGGASARWSTRSPATR